MIAQTRVAAALVALTLLSLSATPARVVEAFDMSEVPYAELSAARFQQNSALPSLSYAWRDDRDPLATVVTFGRLICAVTEGATARCWSEQRRSLRAVLSEKHVGESKRAVAFLRRPPPFVVHPQSLGPIDRVNRDFDG